MLLSVPHIDKSEQIHTDPTYLGGEMKELARELPVVAGWLTPFLIVYTFFMREYPSPLIIGFWSVACYHLHFGIVKARREM